MNRKNLIILAVLVNAGLMTVFFISALKSNGEDEVVTTSMPISLPVAQAPITQSAPADEMDQVLKQHATSEIAPAVLTMTATETTVQSSSSPLTQASFADDLKAISQTETPAQAQEKPLAAAHTSEVTVKKGDVLEKIARRHGISVDDLMKTNGLSSSRLKIGQVLKVPAKNAPKAEVAKQAGGEEFYIVKNGDNPWTIAVKNHIKVEELLKLNGLNEEKARRLKPGDKLRIK